MLEKEPVSFASLYGGAVIEALDYELSNAIRNIKDPNTEAEKVRTINLVVKIKPNKERNLASFQFQASFKPVPAEALETSILMDKDEAGRPVAFEMRPEEEVGAVLPIFGMHANEGGR